MNGVQSICWLVFDPNSRCSDPSIGIFSRRYCSVLGDRSVAQKARGGDKRTRRIPPDVGSSAESGSVDGSPSAARRSLSDRAYRALLDSIIDLTLPPGARFSTATVGSELGYGRMPMREALTRLERDGLVEILPQSGFRVSSVTPLDVHDQFRFRMLLEGEAAALAALRGLELGDGSYLLELDRLCQSSYDPGDPSTIGTCLAQNKELHLGIARASGSRRIYASLEKAIDEQERLFHILFRSRDVAEVIVHEHRELLDAVLGGDPVSARRVAVEAVAAAAERTMRALSESPIIMNTNVGEVS